MHTDSLGKRSRYRLFFGALCLAAVVLLTFEWSRSASAQTYPKWKERWEKVLSEAKREGKVVVLGPPGDLIRRAMTEGFRKAFPDIMIEYSGGRSGEHATKLRAERDGGIYSADIFLGGTTTANIQLKPIGAQDPVEPSLLLPEVRELKYWRDNTLEFSDESTRYNLVFVNQLKTPLIYNDRLAKVEEIDELYELLDPKWKGKFVINDPLPSGAGNVTFRWIWQVLGPQKATEYYRKIRAQAGAVDRDQRRQIEWVAQGKYAFLLGPSDGVMQQLLMRGLKFEVLPEFKDYGTLITASFGSVSLINRAPHPKAGKVFLNWVLTKEAQTAWSRVMNHVSRRVDVAADHLPPYIIPKPRAKFSSTTPQPGEYWRSHSEENVQRSPEETKILIELFGR